MNRRGRRWVWLSVLLIASGLFIFRHAQADTRAAPEVSLYYTHDNVFRSRLSTGATWSDEKSDFTSAALEYDLDIGLGSFFRRYVFKDPNVEKSKRITLRAGYAYIPKLTPEDKDNDEHRVINEATFRFPLGSAWLLSDRNRLDFRRVGDDDFAQYRNRLRLEYNVIIEEFRTTPYTNIEFYYSTQADSWNQIDATVGAEFPLVRQMLLDFYFTWQFRENNVTDYLVGLGFQKHL
jgi:hypothetical protein